MSRKAAKACHRQHTVADFETLDTLSEGLDFACNFTTGRKGARRFHLVHVLDNQRIGEVQPRCTNAYAHLFFGRRGGLHLGQL